jgi:hypothetical protein
LTSRPRYHVRAPPKLRGLDTEACRGDLLVICSPTSFFEPTGDPNDLLSWLWNESREANFFYNLTYDRDIICKPFASLMSGTDKRVSYGDWEISFIGNKSFQLDRNGRAHHTRRYYDISGFFSDGERTLPLEETARLFLGAGKLPDVDRARLGEEREYYAANRDRVIEYCKRDAELAEQLSRLLVSTLKSGLGFYPSRYHSKASISKAWAEVYHPELFRYWKTEPKSLFREAYKGGIFLTRVLGRVPGVTEIDIVSAYGAPLATIPRLDKLVRRVGTEYHPDALLGAYRILIDYDGRLPLTPQERGLGAGYRTLYPISRGLRGYTASKAEMDYFIRTGRNPRVLMADEWFGTYVPQFPEVRALLDRIAALKSAATNNPRFKVERMLHKTIVNALYGCLCESRYGETPLTTWPLASEVTARCRVKIWDEWDHLARHGAEIISINTDSIRFVPGSSSCVRCNYSGGLGEFEVKFRDATVTHYQSGIAIIESPETAGTVLRKRGKPLLTPDLLRGATGTSLLVPSRHVTHLFEAIIQHRPQDIGVFDSPNNPESATVLDLQANLFSAQFDPKLLTFETLNRQPVLGYPPDYDDICTLGDVER